MEKTHGKNKIDPQLETQLRVLRELKGNTSVNQRQIAENLGISLGRVNYCLQALISRGFVKVENFRKSKTKRKYIYLLTAQGIARKSRLTIDFLERKQAEYAHLREEIEYLEWELHEHD